MRVFGIDPGSERTGYGCVESDGRRHRLVLCGAVRTASASSFPDKLAAIYRELAGLIGSCRPQCVAIESLYHAVNVRSALKLGHARGVAMLAAVEAGIEVAEYSPAEIKRAVVGYGRAEKPQVQQMIKLLLGLDRVPTPHDAADALAVAICHLHQQGNLRGNRAVLADSRGRADSPVSAPQRSWRDYRPADVPSGLRRSGLVGPPIGGAKGPPPRAPRRGSGPT